MESDSDLKQAFRTTAITSGALVASLFLYAIMVGVIQSRLKPFPGLLVSGHRHQTLRYFVFAAAVGVVLLVRLSGRSMLKVTPGEDYRGLISRLSRTTVITLTLGELPAILGFILFLLTGFPRDFYLLLFVSLFLQFMYFPRFGAWRDLVRERFPQKDI